MQRSLVCLACLATTFPVWAEVETYRIDPDHSFANWEVRHIVARTAGSFPGVSGNIVLDRDNVARSKVEAAIDVYSLGSGHAKRDLHLLSDEFLDARKYPEMKFVSTSVQPSGPDQGVILGQLTLHGTTRQVKMAYQILGYGNDPWDGYRTGLMGAMKINRSDFGISKFADNGPVGNDVEITLLVEGIKLAADGTPFSVKKAAAEKAAAEKAKAVQPAPAPVTPAQPESLEDQLKKKLLKGLFN